MFGRYDIGQTGWCALRQPFCHKSHYGDASRFINFDQRVRKYMRDQGCDLGAALKKVEY